MATETEIRKEIAGERAQLTDAVSSLREELAGARKKAGAAVGALVAAKIALRLLRRR
jgi:hypothetical protein